eukprot:TRINITY_DN66859_c5_g1_i1.p2 TRINITY_DN66859_c5_g1~~TRINITY_DN66859_c5_g1_i1.p2  ORF type:complete len:151 (-),score=1.13 TRINITY_DN66859_c5_g1_i1:286-738(-)
MTTCCLWTPALDPPGLQGLECCRRNPPVSFFDKITPKHPRRPFVQPKGVFFYLASPRFVFDGDGESLTVLNPVRYSSIMSRIIQFKNILFMFSVSSLEWVRFDPFYVWYRRGFCLAVISQGAHTPVWEPICNRRHIYILQQRREYMGIKR